MRFESIFAGKMLGDGYINLNRKRARFCFTHSLNDKDYADYCYHLLCSFIPYGKKCRSIEHVKDKRNGKTYSRIVYQSKVSTVLDDLYSLWYTKKSKCLPFQFVCDYLDTQGMAIWYQDDGSYKPKCNRIILSTESFKQDEIYFLKNLLDERFKVHAYIDCQNRLDISSKKEVRKFLSLVAPYIDNSMSRKGINNQMTEWFRLWNNVDSQSGIARTTIYLSDLNYKKIRDKGYSKLLNEMLDNWLDQQWVQLNNYRSIYNWILEYQDMSAEKSIPITPRFRSTIKAKLDILSDVTGFELSELVNIALSQIT